MSTRIEFRRRPSFRVAQARLRRLAPERTVGVVVDLGEQRCGGVLGFEVGPEVEVEIPVARVQGPFLVVLFQRHRATADLVGGWCSSGRQWGRHSFTVIVVDVMSISTYTCERTSGGVWLLAQVRIRCRSVSGIAMAITDVTEASPPARSVLDARKSHQPFGRLLIAMILEG